MPVIKELEFNKRHEWDEIVSSYPDMYAFLAEPEFDTHGRLASGILVDICDYEHREEVSRRILIDEAKECIVLRTTPNSNGINLGGIEFKL